MARKKVHDKKWSAFYVIALVILLVYTFSLFAPVVWAIITSFKDVTTDWNLGNTVGAPKTWYWQNYVYVFSKFTLPITINGGQPARVGVIGMFSNSFFYAIGCAFCKTAIPLVMSFLCARFPYKLSKIIHTIVIVTMILPIVGSLPSEIKMAHALGLYDSILGLWFMKSNFLGMYFLVFYNTFKSFSPAYIEAAKLDGANNFSVFFRIVLPLVKNTFFTVMLIEFIIFWNDYQIPLIYLPNHPTLAQAMYQMGVKSTDQKLTKPPMRLAGAMIMFVPLFTVFIVFHKKFMGNLTMGGVKG